MGILKKIFLLSLPAFLAIEAFASDTLMQQKKILAVMEKVADWQLNQWQTKGSRHKWWDWTNAAGYTGLFALGNISKNKNYQNTLINIFDSIGWETGPRRFHADDYCIGQSYSLLYMKKKQKNRIANFQRLADSVVSLPHDESLEWKNQIANREWAWCDALFMGPTALAYLSTATGNKKYLNTAATLWWKTTDYLYDSTEHLYFRDQSYFDKKEKNGQKVFWSRGNGWVMGGLVRVLANMPNNYPGRKRFVDLYKDMASKIASLQQPDGTWHASLLDPESYKVKEASGTGFYAYSLLWGLNNGLLDKATYWPVVNKAWHALVDCVHDNGMLGYVQQIGAAPDKVDMNSTQIYGVGAFLLAGSELYTYLAKNKVHDDIASKPLFSDPIYDGAADPVIIWNKSEKKWFMFYTNRRANISDSSGVKWVHGTRIGIAESYDGINWKYRDTANINYRPDAGYTHWAPDVIEHNGTYHMYLTYVPGIFNDWNHPRNIIHLTSSDLFNWQYQSTLKLVNDKVIDASVFRLPDGTWRMWYNNERDGKSIWYADSKDLYSWEDKGKAIAARGEGPKVFKWQNTYFMIVDVWKGMEIYQSNDLLNWKKQTSRILEEPGMGKDDQAIGGHCDVVVNNGHAYVYYFTHPGRTKTDPAPASSIAARRSVIQIAELDYKGGEIICDRNKLVNMQLVPKQSAIVPGNPIIRDKFTADPAAMVYNNTVYLYTGHDEAPEKQNRYVMHDWTCYSSTDMVNWTEHPSPLSVKAFDWALDDAWASQVIERNHKFYWYVAISHKTIHGKAIGIAVSDKPTGPFKDSLGKALITNDMTTETKISWDDIDPTVFIDNNKHAYLFWGNTTLHYVKLKENMIEMEGDIKTISLPHFTEAPWVHKHGEWYYLSYAYEFPEKIAYAMSRSISGPWVYKGIINEIAGNSNTNHQAIIDYKGRSFFIYHNGALAADAGSFHRSVCIDELYYNKDGTIRRVVMTSEGVKAVK